MALRSLYLALGLAGLAALSGGVAAQDVVPYQTLDDDDGERLDRPGVRVGLNVGAYTYFGPDVLFGSLDDQDDVRQTRPAVTAYVSFPLSSDRLYGRLVGGVLNLGADERPDVAPGENPFLTNETFLAEGNLLFNLLSFRESPAVPYLFSGLGALFAGDEVAYYIPAGIGVDIPLTRNFSLVFEGSYRFLLNEVGEQVASATASAGAGGPCDEKPDLPECKPKPTPEECEEDPTKPGCEDVLDEDDELFDDRFGPTLFTGGIQLGFAPPPPAPVIPPPPAPIVVEPPPPPVVVEPEPAVCDLVELNSVYFDAGSATLSAGARSLLDENVQLLLENPECCIFVDGYTDTQEYDRFGMPLAGRRAQAVYDYYLAQGIEASRMHVRNRGVSLPSCDKEDPDEGCRRGRRVETIPLDCERFLFLIENPSYDAN